MHIGGSMVRSFYFLICIFGFFTLAAAIPDVPLYTQVEITIENVPASTSPGNPDEIAVDMLLKTPSGKEISVPAFAMKNVQRTVGTQVKWNPVGDFIWKVRFAPEEIGDYSGTIQVKIKNGSAQKLQDVSLKAVSSKKKGFIRVAKNNPLAFEYSTGEPFTAIGECIAWSSQKVSTKDPIELFAKWIDKMAAQGGNYFRIWLATYFGDGLTILTSKPYVFDQGVSFILDSLLSYSDSKGVVIKHCLEITRSVNSSDYGHNPNSPYMQKNGGPVSSNDQLFTNADVKKMWKALQRYMVARFGASTSTFCWEQWNEMDGFVAVNSQKSNMITFIDEMCTHFKEIDPYRHMNSNSLGSTGNWPDMWSKPSIDIVSYHDYATPRYDGKNLCDVYGPPLLGLQIHKKPVMLNECGMADASWNSFINTTHPDFMPGSQPRDSKGYAFREALWVGFFTTGSSTAMHWWWDDMIDPYNFYPQYKPVAKLVEGLPLNNMLFTFGKAALNKTNLISYTIQSEWGTVAWINNKDDYWKNIVINGKQPQSVSGATAVVPVQKKGEYKISLINAWTGDEIKSTVQNIDADKVTIELPLFTTDILVKIVGTGTSAIGTSQIKNQIPNLNVFYKGKTVHLSLITGGFYQFKILQANGKVIYCSSNKLLNTGSHAIPLTNKLRRGAYVLQIIGNFGVRATPILVSE
jgi:hypothetical protein